MHWCIIQTSLSPGFCFVDRHQSTGKQHATHDGDNQWWSVCINLMLQASVSIRWFRKKGFYQAKEVTWFKENALRRYMNTTSNNLKASNLTDYLEIKQWKMNSTPAQREELYTKSHKSASWLIVKDTSALNVTDITKKEAPSNTE